MKTYVSYLNVAVLSIFLVLCTLMSCDDSPDEPIDENESKIQISNDTALGEIITDGDGVALYFFAKDVTGVSNCLSGCLDSWPIFYVEDPEIGTGLASSDFGAITHANSSMQTTYKGWPLYYYSPTADGVIDEAGDTDGEGVGNVWFVAKPDYTIMMANGQLVGNDGQSYTSSYEVGEGATSYFVDAMGRTLYAFSHDYNGINTFTNSDFSNDASWPVFTESLDKVPSTLTLSDFGTIDVFGRDQVTYKGWPLYYFGQDAERGETKGVSVPTPGVWPIVNSSTETAPEEPEPVATVKITNNTTLGDILTDADGRTLYYYAKDPSGTSACMGGCLTNWPLFYTADVVLTDAGLSEDDSANVDQGGTMITTYKGWPLYYYTPGGTHGVAGNTAGEGVGGIWYVMKPNYSLMIAKTQLVGNDGNNYLGDYTLGTGETTYFTDALGRTLYTFSNDALNDNNFTASDFSNNGSWPIFHVDIEELPSGMMAEDFGVIDVFGESQLTFKGWPVYYFGADAARGQNKGVSQPSPGVWPIINNEVVAAD